MKWFGVFRESVKPENLVECRETEFQAEFFRKHCFEVENSPMPITTKPIGYFVAPVEIAPIVG